jgi:hypothetical protein
VGLTPGGAFAAADSLGLALEFDEEDDDVDVDVLFEQGQLAASGGTMQLDAPITKITAPPRFAIDLFIWLLVTEKGANREDKDKANIDIDCPSYTVNHLR